MADRIQIDFTEVDRLQHQLTSAANGLESVLQEFDARMTANDARWSGAAHDAAVSTRRQWTRSMEGARTSLSSTATALAAANEAFQKVEDTIARSF